MIEKAIRYIEIKYPLMSAIIKSIPIEVAEDSVAIAWTDCRRIYISRRVVSSASLRDLVAILLHEALHVALQHCDARSKSYVGTWNIATDCVVNYVLSLMGVQIPSDLHRYTGVPSTVITPELVSKLTGVDEERVRRMSAEEIYYLLLRKGVKVSEASDIVVSNGDGECCGGKGEEKGGREGKDSARGGNSASIKGLRELLRGAIELGLKPSLSGSALLELHYALGTLPRTNWRKVIRNIASELARGGYRYSWIKLSRRLGEDAMGRYRFEKPRSPLIYLLIDVSGSVVSEPHILRDFLNEVINVAKQLRARVIAIAWDTRVVGTTEVSYRESVEEIARRITKCASRGGGGTVIDEAIEYAVKHFKELRGARSAKEAAMIILTDGMVAKPSTNAIHEARKLFKKILEVYTIEKSPLPYPAVPYSSLRS